MGDGMKSRRAFISFLCASPLYAGMEFLGRSFAQVPAPTGEGQVARAGDGLIARAGDGLIARAGEGLIARAGDALDVFDFEPVAHQNIPPAHWGYLVSGVDGEDTLKANRAAYSRYQLQARLMIDVSKIDLSVELFGEKFNSPIILCPLGAQRAFHPEGEIAVA